MDANIIQVQIPLFGGLEQTLLDQITKTLRIRRYKRREFVIHKNKVVEGLSFLLAGSLQVIDVGEDGREVGLNFIPPGDFVGEISVIDEQFPSASVIAASESVVAVLPTQAARQLFFNHPLIAERMLRHLTAKLRTVSAFRGILGIPDAPRRVYALIQHLAHPNRVGLRTIEDAPTHQQLATMANTSRETVTRALGNLLKHQVLEKDRRRYIVRAPEVLEEVVKTGVFA